MIVASCGGSSEQGLIRNSPDKALAGCTVDAGSCNQKVVSGVVAKVTLAETGEAVVRFVTLTDSNDDGDFSDGNFTYRDGNQTIVFTGGVGPGGETITTYVTLGVYNTNTFVTLPPGDAFAVFEDGIVGEHTDAGSVPVAGTATYPGSSYIAYGDNSTHFIAEEFGDSTLEVDFGSALADLTIDLDPVDLAITEFDQIVSNDMVIDGYSFTGDEVVRIEDTIGGQSMRPGMFWARIWRAQAPACSSVLLTVTETRKNLQPLP